MWVYRNNRGETKVKMDRKDFEIVEGVLKKYKGSSSVVVIPDSVTSIGYSAFRDCTGLTSITIPDSVTSIGSYAFDGTAWYNNQPAGLVYAGKVAYAYKGTMPSNTSIVLKEGTLGIAGSAFSRCTGLTSVTIPDSVTSIGSNAFSYTAWYNNQPKGLVYAGKVAYKYKGTMPSNTSIVLKEGTLGIADDAFEGCTGLTSVTIPDSVTNIGDFAFSDCTGLTSITIPDSLTSIGERAFYNCTGLTSITIPDSVTSIGWGAFAKCTELTSVTIPDSVTSIGDWAFSGCTGLTSITVAKGNTKYHSAENCLIETESKTLIAGCKNSIIPTDGSVTSIGGAAFEGCTGLTSITIPDSVTSIGERAFYNTLWYNKQPVGLVYAGKVAYKYKGTMPSNTSIVLKEGTLGIADYAFLGCTGLTSITIPDSVTSIGDGAFEGCTGLTSVTIPDSVTSIGSNAFYWCSWLTSVTIGDSVTSIGREAFSDCTGLTSVSIGNSVTSIDYEAFLGCTGLTSVTIGGNVTSIGEYAFAYCEGLTSITIPNSVTSIDSWAFRGCTGLTSINFNGTIEQWNAISKGDDWKSFVPSSCKVICTDGTVGI